MKNREENKYKNVISEEVLNATEMLEFVKDEAKRQYEDFHDDKFEDCNFDEQQEIIMEQFAHQLNYGDWVLLHEDKNKDIELKVSLDIYVKMFNDEDVEDALDRLREKLDYMCGVSYQIYNVVTQVI